MKNIIIILIALLCLFPQKSSAQNNGAVEGSLVTGGAVIVDVEEMEERAELIATQWILSNNSELKSFSIKTLSFDGKKLKDMSHTSVITYKIQEFMPGNKPELDGKKQVLFGFTSQGWINQYGINFDKIKWILVDEEEWMNMMVSYVKISSEEQDDSKIFEILKKGKVGSSGVKIKSKLKIPFYKLKGDMYVVTDYSSDFKLIYNEKSLGIYLKETNDLVQIGRSDVVDIHDFFFDE